MVRHSPKEKPSRTSFRHEFIYIKGGVMKEIIIHPRGIGKNTKMIHEQQKAIAKLEEENERLKSGINVIINCLYIYKDLSRWTKGLENILRELEDLKEG